MMSTARILFGSVVLVGVVAAARPVSSRFDLAASKWPLSVAAAGDVTPESQQPPVPGGVVDPRTAPETRLLAAAEATDWLAAVNQYRAAASLPLLVEDPAFQTGCVNHSIYCVRNNVLVHAEDPSLPFYTPEGDLAGRSSNVMASSSAAATDQSAIDLWMAGPFHAVGIIDPVLERTGFGSYREVKPGLQMAATLDVIRGRNPARPVSFPVIWPADGQSLPARCSGGTTACYAGGETPDPLAGCPGYTTPSGLPVILQLGKGSVTPVVTGHSLVHNGTPLEHCVFDETSYANPDTSLQSLGRSVLGSRDAIVLVPRAPLQLGQSYTASITVNGSTYTWTFGVGEATVPTPAVAGDYDGDRRKDTTVFRPSTGTWYIIRSGTGTAVAIRWGEPGDLPVPADYDGDARTDIAVYRPSTGTWYIVPSSTGVAIGTQWGLLGDVPVPADYDGDGKADVAVFRPSDNVWYIFRTGSGTAVGVSWGQPGDIPIPADFDGDRKTDPTVFRPASGTWYQLRSTTSTGFGVLWGAAGDTPLAADYDGDGKADPTVFRGNSGTWFQLRSTTGSGFGVLWGVAGDEPVPGEYDGDGKADATIFRSLSGTWYQLRSTTGSGFAVGWGMAGDLPL